MTINTTCNDGEINISVFASGPPGPANTLTVGDVYAVPTGNPPEVTITGEAPQQTIDFGLPTGPQGPPGGATDESVAAWISDDTSLTTAALAEWIGYRYTYVDPELGDGVANATTGIQAALDNRGTVVIPPGDYLTDGPLTLREGTRLLGHGATIHRAGSNGMMMINWDPGDTTTPAYDGASHIVVEGLSFDGHAGDSTWPTVGTPNQPLTFSHCTDVVVRECRFMRGHTNHALEFNAVDTALVDTCVFEGWDPGVSTTRGAIQIDAASTGPGVRDGTVTKRLTVHNTRFSGLGSLGPWSSAVESHTYGNERYSGIRVSGCHILGASAYGIRAYYWADSIIENNVVTIANAVTGAGVDVTNSTGVQVRGNSLRGVNLTSIEVQADAADVTVSGNVVQGWEDGIVVRNNGTLVSQNLITDTSRYSVSCGGSDTHVTGNVFRATNGASVVRFFTSGTTGNSVTANQYRADGDTPATYAVSAAGGQTVYIFGNDFTGVTNLTSGTADTSTNKI